MAKLRMTYKNLKALRKSKEYQAVIIDLVNADVLSKAKAEALLGYNIPGNLIGETETTEEPVDDPVPPVKVDITVQTAGSGIELGTLHITEDVNKDEIGDFDFSTPELLFNESWFTPSEAFTNDYLNTELYSLSIYASVSVPTAGENTDLEATTKLKDIPEGAYITVTITDLSASSSSS